MKNLTTKERLIYFARESGYGRNKFEDYVGLGSGYLSSKSLSINSDAIEKILDKFPNLNLGWLFSGDGSMSIDNKENNPFLVTPSGVKYYELPNGKFRMRVPTIPIKAYAKYIDEYRDAEFIDNLEETEFIVDKIGHGKYFAFEIKGDSMDDGSIKSIPHGSTVLARELKREHWIEGNGLKTKDYPYWIIVLDNTILCKQIIKQDNVEGKLICHSLNPSKEYNSDFDISLNDVKQLLNIIQKTLPAT